MWGHENLYSCIADKFVRTNFSDFTKKKRNVKKKQYFKERVYKRWLYNFLISGGMTIVYIESREVN